MLAVGCSAIGTSTTAADELGKIERNRLRALVLGDAAAARTMHADDFQLITPFGMTVGRED
jgi:hypothetical protein